LVGGQTDRPRQPPRTTAKRDDARATTCTAVPSTEQSPDCPGFTSSGSGIPSLYRPSALSRPSPASCALHVAGSVCARRLRSTAVDRVHQGLPRGSLRVQVHPRRWRDDLLETVPCGPGRTGVATLQDDKPGPRPGQALLLQPAVRIAKTSRGTRGPATQDPIMTLEAQDASESEKPGMRMPPSRPPRRARQAPGAWAAHSSTECELGRPTRSFIRVVHIAPGPTPTFTRSAHASTSQRRRPRVTPRSRPRSAVGLTRRDRRSASSSCPGGSAACPPPDVTRRRAAAWPWPRRRT